MNPNTGKTSGKPWWCPPLPWSPTLQAGHDSLRGMPYPTGNCPHADRIRLRRVPKWLGVFRDDGYGKLIPITQLFKRRMRSWLKRIELSKNAG